MPTERLAELNEEQYTALSDSEKEWYKTTEDGVYVINLQGFDNVNHLSSALERQKNENKAKADALAKTQRELAEAKKALEEYTKKKAAAQQDIAISEGNWQKAFEQAEIEREKAERLAEERERALEAKYRKILLDDNIKTQALAHGVDQARLEQFMRVFNNRFDLEEDSATVVFKDAKGLFHMKTPAEHFAQLQKEAPWAFKIDREKGPLNPKDGGGVKTRPSSGVLIDTSTQVVRLTDEMIAGIKSGQYRSQ